MALLVARIRRLDPARIGSWAPASDPAAVAPVRAACRRWLAERGLEDLGFATEPIVHELAINAVRFGVPPITVRLLHDRTLFCEVFDASNLR